MRYGRPVFGSQWAPKKIRQHPLNLRLHRRSLDRSSFRSLTRTDLMSYSSIPTPESVGKLAPGQYRQSRFREIAEKQDALRGLYWLLEGVSFSDAPTMVSALSWRLNVFRDRYRSPVM